jgi:hypothetical protein
MDNGNVWSDDESSEAMLHQMKQRIQTDAELLASMATIEEINDHKWNIDFITRFVEAGGDNHSGNSWQAVCGLACKILREKKK